MTTRSSQPLVGLLITVTVLVAIVVGATAVWWIDWSGERGSGLANAFKYDLQQYQKIDPALFHYHQVAKIAVPMHAPRAIAVGIDDQILVAGDQRIQVFASPPDGEKNVTGETAGNVDHPHPNPLRKGEESGVESLPKVAETEVAKLREINLEAEPYSVTVGNAEHAHPGRIYVGMWDHVEVFAPDGTRVATWPKLGIVTAVTTSEKNVFVADAHAKVVWQFDPDGKQVAKIDPRSASVGAAGFIVPSPYFAVAMSPDGLLRVANPGAHRVEAYTLDGQLEFAWGQATEQIAGFCGCCNPANMAILPDGRIVTAEKGISRVKVYSSTGTFESVVAGPELLSPSAAATVETRDEYRLRPVAVAADSHGRILVLDPTAQCVRVFAENEK